MSARFEGQVALITGSGDALCLALAQAFMAEGAQVALAGSDGQGGSAAEAIGVHYFALDPGNAQAVQSVPGSVVDQYGRIDIWLHYVGAAPAGPLCELAPAVQDAALAAAVGGALNCARAIGPVMIRQGSGRVVFVASVAGLFAQSGQTLRGALEASLFMLAKGLAVEWAPHGLRVNAIARGIVQQGAHAPDEQLLGRIPVGRAAQPQELLEAALFLADEQESSFVTGEVLRVDGGWTAYHLFHPFDEAF